MSFADKDEALRQGLLHHQSGRLPQAEQIYREILAVDPCCADAWHLLGTLAHQAGRSDAGLQMIERAMQLGLQNAEALNTLGECYRCVGRYQEAKRAYQTAIQLNQNYAEALSNLGLLLNTLGRYEDALPLLQRAIALRPDIANAHYNYGFALANLCELGRAIEQWEIALQLQPDHRLAMKNLGYALQRQNRNEEAADIFKRLVERHPGFSDGYTAYAELLASMGRFDEAIAAGLIAVELRPDSPETHNALAAAYSQAGQFEEALVAAKTAVGLNPAFDKAMVTIGITYRTMQRYSESAEWFERAVAIDPTNVEVYKAIFYVYCEQKLLEKALELTDRGLLHNPEDHGIHFCRSMALLSLGRYVEGFREYDSREYYQNIAFLLERLGKSMWNGTDLSNLTILVHCEQGFGDVFQFIRYIPMLTAKGARVVLEARSEIQSLMETVPGVTKVIQFDLRNLEDFDFHCMLPSLARHFETTIETIPSKIPYLHADPQRIEKWRRVVEAHARGLKVGLVWRGNQIPNPRRSTSIKSLSRLADVPNVSWYSLQTGEARGQLKDAPGEMNILDLGKDLHDFADTAAIMTQLDLMITIDTSAAHLAGALGVKTWVMLPYIPDWRWWPLDDHSPWYPTLRLFRQRETNDWTPVIEQIRMELFELAKAATSR